MKYNKFINTIKYAIICIIMFVLILILLGKDHQIIESFSYLDPIYSPYDITNSKSQQTSHTVNLPINTDYSCQNMCGPNAQCSITREQCSSDIDCYGCQTPTPVYKPDTSKPVIGDNDAGRLIYNQNPQYSVLTTDIATTAGSFNGQYSQVPKLYYGVDKWMNSANAGMQYFYRSQNYTYKTQPDKYKDLPEYPVHESITGLFEDYGPVPANAIIR